MWGDVESFLESGFGSCATDGKTLASWCTIEYRGPGHCGIGVETVGRYQKRGLSTACAAALLRLFAARGLRPYWDCWTRNIPSARVAQRLGFEINEEYDCMFLNFEDRADVAETPPLSFEEASPDDLHGPVIEDLLSQCIYNGADPARRAAALATYDTPGNWLLCARLNGLLVGLAGVCPDGNVIGIRHLAVLAGHRRKGIGRQLVAHLRSLSPGSGLAAETDKDTVEFYRKCGFTCRSIGEKHPGTERFMCTIP